MAIPMDIKGQFNFVHDFSETSGFDA